MSKSLQLYSLATPNGQKVAIALEEIGVSYEAHRINIMKGEQFYSDFLKINPNGKIPALVDLEGPENKPLAIFESGAILLYLAEKYNKLLPPSPSKRSQAIQWLFFQVGGVGPMFGQFGYFYKYADKELNHEYALNRYTLEVKRILQVLETQLEKNKYLAGDYYSIADIANLTWVNALDKAYHADNLFNLAEFKHLSNWLDTCLEREAVQRGLKITPFWV
ncbi:MAG: glutathione S-transferase N-terminal domain-containing protein [Colwellia sp.]